MSSPKAIALFPGIVQGVVVQITTDAFNKSGSFDSKIGNFTYIQVDLCSLYSISASANAVFSTVDHITGLEPLNKLPFSKNLKNSFTIVDSALKDIVVYGFDQSPITPSLINSSRWISIHLEANSLHSFLN